MNWAYFTLLFMIFSNIFIILSGSIGLLTSFLILINKKSNLVLNICFIIPILLFGLKQFFLGLLFFTSYASDNKLNDTMHLTVLVWPLIYTYFKKLVCLERSLSLKDLTKYLFIPTSIIVLIEVLLIVIPKIFNFEIVFLTYLVPLVLSTYYSYKSYRLLLKTLWNPTYISVNVQDRLLKQWSKSIFLALILVPLEFIFILYFYNNLSLKSFVHSWRILASFINILICLKILRSPELLYGMKVIEKKITANKSVEIILDSFWIETPNVIPNNVQDKMLEKKVETNFLIIVHKIENLVLNDDFFLKSNLKIDDVAYKLNISKSNLKYFFKYHCTISFIEFKNTIRVIEAKKLIDNGFLEKNTLLGLSERVGFNSYDPFYRSFKKFTGKVQLE